MNGAKICQQQIWRSRNYQINPILGNLETRSRYSSIQATSITQFQLKILIMSLLRS